MLELFGDKILMNGRHILTLPPGFAPNDYMVLRELLEMTDPDVQADREQPGPDPIPPAPTLEDLTHWPCVIDPYDKLYVLHGDMPALPLPEDWKQVWLINWKDIQDYLDSLS